MTKNLLIVFGIILLGYIIAAILGYKPPKLDLTSVEYLGFLTICVANFVAGTVWTDLNNKMYVREDKKKRELATQLKIETDAIERVKKDFKEIEDRYLPGKH